MKTNASAGRGTRNSVGAPPPHGPPDDSPDDTGLELPVNPDEGLPLIPDDDERVVNVPS